MAGQSGLLQFKGRRLHWLAVRHLRRPRSVKKANANEICVHIYRQGNLCLIKCQLIEIMAKP